jgi:hypothetical protein
MSETEIDEQASYIAESFGISLSKAREIARAVAAKQAKHRKNR